MSGNLGLHAELEARLAGLPVAGGETQILPLIIGGAADATRMAEAALEHGVFAQAIRPPTVPEGTSRLRLAVMATHTRELREAARYWGAPLSRRGCGQLRRRRVGSSQGLSRAASPAGVVPASECQQGALSRGATSWREGTDKVQEDGQRAVRVDGDRIYGAGVSLAPLAVSSPPARASDDPAPFDQTDPNNTESRNLT